MKTRGRAATKKTSAADFLTPPPEAKTVERSHSDILKEVDSKRLKIQAQACQNLMDGTDKEVKKMSERVAESCEAMKVFYSEFMVDAQTIAARGMLLASYML
ncbi:hypothetical protein SOVF_103460 [Spinacia oleracea]|nr:hypothetical protein SOVF_103460 [Spinacia oleracea]